MTGSIITVALVTSALVVGNATWWLVRHELAVRRFRAGAQHAGSGDRR